MLARGLGVEGGLGELGRFWAFLGFRVLRSQESFRLLGFSGLTVLGPRCFSFVGLPLQAIQILNYGGPCKISL